ncbi:putative protein phosphatase 2C 4 [Ananas comosus]|uniref:protein-serine/threonine phosphatase n=1 Tax=Ananas comosus TaxID=4615 RepID=A0A199W3H7_ANACO|nr:putative protein phosphatase 2C 4 [Ananas comosus]
MGNGCAKLTLCFAGGPRQIRRRHVAPAALPSDPCDEGFGHSFCYLRPEPPSAPTPPPPAAVVEEETTTFRSISGAAISANASTPLSTSLFLLPPASSSSDSGVGGGGGAFESSDSFASVPLQPVPRFSSGPLSGPIAGDRGFLSGPIERGFLSGPLDPRASSPTSSSSSSTLLRRSLSHTIRLPRRRRLPRPPRPLASAASILRGLSNAIISRAVPSSSAFAPKRSDSASPDPQTLTLTLPLQWAQGKAGEDRVHVVVSESPDDAPSADPSGGGGGGGGWVFVGIYDGFNGPDATDYLLSHLYTAVHRELRGLLWDDDEGGGGGGQRPPVNAGKPRRASRDLSRPSDPSRRPITSSHVEVLKALSKALKKTEEEYLDTADKMLDENPELALMGSCVLVMVMKGEDVYLMNVGDSRAILASQSEHGSRRSAGTGLEQINEEFLDDLGGYLHSLSARQLTLDHSTCVEEEWTSMSCLRYHMEIGDDITMMYRSLSSLWKEEYGDLVCK